MIPVSFRCRCFHRASSATRRSIVRTRQPAHPARELAGKRIGVPEWAQTAAMYSRGLLAHEYGVDLRSIHWFQAGVNEPGRKEKVRLELPPGFRPDSRRRPLAYPHAARRRSRRRVLRSAAGPFVTGDRARAPVARELSGRRIRIRQANRHLSDHACCRAAARNLRAHRWLAMNLFRAFDEAKNRSVARARDFAASFFPLPWTPYLIAAVERAPGTRSVALRRGSQSDHPRRVCAICVRTGRLPPPADGRDAFPAGAPGDVQDLRSVPASPGPHYLTGLEPLLFHRAYQDRCCGLTGMRACVISTGRDPATRESHRIGASACVPMVQVETCLRSPHEHHFP